jgi:putative ABC transport system substrate-binding protein
MPAQADRGSRTAAGQRFSGLGCLLRTPNRHRGAGSIWKSFRLGLRDLGWVEGKNLVIEIRWAGLNPQRQRELAAELKALPVALILAFGTASIRAAR